MKMELLGLVGPAIGIGKCVAEPIKRQFSYLCCFSANVQNLMDEAKKLEAVKAGMDEHVNVAERNNKIIVPRVVAWLEDVDKTLEDYRSGIEPEIEEVERYFLAINSRFSLSRKATKMTETMKKLQDDYGKLGEISYPAPPASMPLIPVPQMCELESRKHFEENIMVTLREKKVSIIGIFGMGGVGKTTIAKKIMSRASKAGGEGLFDEIVMVVVSQPVDMLKIQQEIADFLGLSFEVESLAARAHELRSRLIKSNKSILMVLDDLSVKLNLMDLGIPDQSDMRDNMILLTSRNRDVFSAMNVEKAFQMKTLEDEEAWALFDEKVGARVDLSLLPIAQEVVRECKGLPVALVTIGKALKDETKKSIWEDALNDLRRGNPHDIPEFLAEVYNPLKISYDLLESENAKSVFLMCRLFPEDYSIPISDLSLYALGLSMFDGITRLKDARNKVEKLVEILRSRSLLLDARDGEHIKMHGVVRDVGISIAAEKGLIDRNLNRRRREEGDYNSDCAWISLFQQHFFEIMFPTTSDFPNLHFVMIWGRSHYILAGVRPSLGSSFFENTRKLRVLSIQNYGLGSLPCTIQFLKQLRTLVFSSCPSLEGISVVSELTSLEIFCCRDCCSIKELPVEFSRLNKLKLLQFEHCRSLETIAPGVLSKLSRLEELTLISGFKNWESRAREGKNASIWELNFLSNLTTLRIEIADASLVAEQIYLSSHLVQFHIIIGITYEDMMFRAPLYGKDMVLALEGEVILGDWIHQLVGSTECLVLEGEGSSKLVPLLPECQHLKRLTISRNVKMTRLCDGIGTVFPQLEFLRIEGIDDLEEVHSGLISSHSFNHLSSIYITNCRSLRSVFSWAFGFDNVFRRLESLRISSCSMLEQLMSLDIGEINCPVIFTKLQELWLYDLPRFTSLCKGVENIEFSASTHIKITKCSSLNSLVSRVIKDHDDSLHLFCEPEVAFSTLDGLLIDGYDSISSLWCEEIPIYFFSGLADLTVNNCGNLKTLFSLSTARNLVSLKKLRIESCREMVKVIEDKVDDVERSPFIKLEELHLIGLPKLKSFCDRRCVLQLSSLTCVCIYNCPEMESFLFGRIISSDSFKNLQRIVVVCSMLEQIVLYNEEENGNDIGGQRSRDRITFPKFEGLRLQDLPRLTSLCKGIQSIGFPLLSEMDIRGCPNLKSVVSSNEGDGKCSGAINPDADGSLHLFCKSQAAFDRLDELTIDGYDSTGSSNGSRLWCVQVPVDFFSRLDNLAVQNCCNIRSLFSPLIARNLVNLSRLYIKSCGDMVKVIEDEEVGMSPFVKLELLRLKNLPKLKAFCEWKCALRFPSLLEVHISECPEMKRFSFGSLTTPKLVKIWVDSENISSYTNDLNDAVEGDFPRLDRLFGSDAKDLNDEVLLGEDFPRLDLLFGSDAKDLNDEVLLGEDFPRLDLLFGSDESYTENLNDEVLLGEDFLHLDLLFGSDGSCTVP